MAFDTGHLLFTAHGTLGNPPAEEWSFGLRLLTAGPKSQAECQAIATSMINPTGQLFGTTSSDPALLTHIKVAYIQPDGHYPPGQSAGEAVISPPASPGGTPLTVPFQVALAVTLGTAVTRGNASKGRFYLPLPKAQRAPDGRLTAAQALAVATEVKVWLNAFKALTPILVPRVFSQGTPTAPAPVSHDVTHVRVGRVLDTIRSRRRNLAEDYQRLAL